MSVTARGVTSCERGGGSKAGLPQVRSFNSMSVELYRSRCVICQLPRLVKVSLCTSVQKCTNFPEKGNDANAKKKSLKWTSLFLFQERIKKNAFFLIPIILYDS